MKQQRFTEKFEHLLNGAVGLARAVEADGLMVVLEGYIDFEKLKNFTTGLNLLIAADQTGQLEGINESGLHSVLVEGPYDSVYEKLTHSLLECVAQDFLLPGSTVVALYSGFEPDVVDSVSLIRLREHLGRLTSRDLRQLTTKVPLETLKMVVDLAVEIGREGREGKPVGTLFVVGDSRRVLERSHAIGFDPVKGYSRKDRNLGDAKVREGIKEIAPLDGAIIVNSDGTVEATARYLDAPASEITLSKGLGARHWSAAAISRLTQSIAVTVSESNGTVRIFQDGEVKLRIEPFRRAMKWKDFEFEPPPPSSSGGES